MPIVLSLLLSIALAILILLAAAHLWTRYLARDVEKLVPRAGLVRPVRGGAIHYVDLGPRDAPPLVLIHGLSGQLQHFTYRLAGLLQDDYRVIALDRPGCGYSSRDGDHRAALSEQARMIGEALDGIGIENPVLVGHSLGGAVALAMALDRPEKTRALALLCPLTHPQTDPPEVFKGLDVASPAMRRLIGNTIAVPLASRTAAAVLEEVFRPEPCPEDFLDRAGGALGLRPAGFVTASADYVAANRDIPGQSARYETELKTPGGILYGAEDAVLSPDRQGQPMTAFGLSWETLPERGHMVPITAPEACADFIRRIVGPPR